MPSRSIPFSWRGADIRKRAVLVACKSQFIVSDNQIKLDNGMHPLVAVTEHADKQLTAPSPALLPQSTYDIDSVCR